MVFFANVLRSGFLVAAFAAVVPDGKRAEYDGHSAGSRHGARQRKRRKIGAEQIELILGEFETRAQRHIAGIDRHKGTPSLRDQIAIGAMMKNLVVEIFGHQIDPAEFRRRGARQVDRGEHLAGEFSLNIPFQKPALEIAENSVAVEGVVGGSETAAGHGGNNVDFVEQAPGLSFSGDFSVGEVLKDAIGHGGGTGAAAREGHDNQHVVGLVGAGEIRETIAIGRVMPIQRHVRRVMRAACGQQDGCQNQQLDEASCRFGF